MDINLRTRDEKNNEIKFENSITLSKLNEF